MVDWMERVEVEGWEGLVVGQSLVGGMRRVAVEGWDARLGVKY